MWVVASCRTIIEESERVGLLATGMRQDQRGFPSLNSTTVRVVGFEGRDEGIQNACGTGGCNEWPVLRP